jgi:hypothetical protein
MQCDYLYGEKREEFQPAPLKVAPAGISLMCAKETKAACEDLNAGVQNNQKVVALRSDFWFCYQILNERGPPVRVKDYTKQHKEPASSA